MTPTSKVKTLVVFMETGASGEYKSRQKSIQGLFSHKSFITFNEFSSNLLPSMTTPAMESNYLTDCGNLNLCLQASPHDGEAINSCSLLMRWRNKRTCTPHVHTYLNDMDRRESNAHSGTIDRALYTSNMLRKWWHTERPSALFEGHVFCVEFNEETCTHPSTSPGVLLPFGVIRY